MGFSRQECWSGLSCPPPGDLSDPGIKPQSSALQVDSLPLNHQGSPMLGETRPTEGPVTPWATADPAFLLDG